MIRLDLDPIDAFARVAEEYCAWAEDASSDPASEARLARRLLLEVMIGAIALPNEYSAANAPVVTDEAYRRVFRRFGALPFNYYSECFNPLLVPAEEPVVADLADDLADIWRDLKTGLLLWQAESRKAAAWHWRFHFEAHWGHHASAALYALQAWFSKNANDLKG